MSKTYIPKNLSPSKAKDKEQVDLTGYPLYPVSEDMYNKYVEEKDVNPEDTSTKKAFLVGGQEGKNMEDDSFSDLIGSDLDIPGSELDDEQENIGSEDEENNYYSLGGDDHDDLDEDKDQ